MNNNDNILKSMVPIMGVVMMAGVVQMLIPTLPTPPAPPEPPAPTGFGCPYGDGLFFDTLAELAAHITEAHPDQPPFLIVDIDWGQP